MIITRLLFILGFLAVATAGCATVDIDRSTVNDPQMQVSEGSAFTGLSPLTGLKTRNAVNGGGSCSVCAH